MFGLLLAEAARLQIDHSPGSIKPPCADSTGRAVGILEGLRGCRVMFDRCSTAFVVPRGGRSGYTGTVFQFSPASGRRP